MLPQFNVGALDVARTELESLELCVAILVLLTTFLFNSRESVCLTRALHLSKVMSGHFMMSMSWIILQAVPQGQCLPLQWQEAQRWSMVFGSLTEGIISSVFPLKMRVVERLSGMGAVTPILVSWYH